MMRSLLALVPARERVVTKWRTTRTVTGALT